MARFTEILHQLSCECLADLVTDASDGLWGATQEPKLEAEIEINLHVCKSANLTSSLYSSSADSKETVLW